MKKSGMASADVALARGRHRARHRPEAARRAARGPRALGIPFAQQTPEVFEGCDLIVLSPDVPADLAPLDAARRRGVRVIGEVELAAPFLKGQTIGITGSNGKTTTTSLIGHILREAGLPVQVGGNIGTPVTAMIERPRDDGWNVLELSSFQLETISEFRAHIGLALNVTQNHLDRHHTFENYAAAKGRLFETQRAGDFAVLNADDPVCVAYADTHRRHAAVVQQPPQGEPGASLCGDKLVLDGKLADGGRRDPHPRPPQCGERAGGLHRGRPRGRGREAIAAAVRTFHAVEHRLEFVRNVSGIDFYNDSKATSVDATLKAIDAFPGGLWVILGGKDKGLDYSPLREPLAAKAHAALLIGAAAAKIADQLQGAVPLVEAKTSTRPSPTPTRMREPGDTVLLAPACASFDQFQQLRASRRGFQADRESIAAEKLIWRKDSKPTGSFRDRAGHGFFRRADPLQRFVDHGPDGPVRLDLVLRSARLAWAVIAPAP